MRTRRDVATTALVAFSLFGPSTAAVAEETDGAFRGERCRAARYAAFDRAMVVCKRKPARRDTVEFDPEACGACPLRAKCTRAASGRGRTVSIAEDEAQQRKFRKLQETAPGRAILRQRTAVEHALAHIAARKGGSARYIGVRRNLFDLRRAAAIQNLEAAHRLIQEAA